MLGENESFISVVMPTCNTPKAILAEAIESILTQTYTKFEYIIVDDHTTDKESKAYLDQLSDERIRIIRNETNLGITKSLNVGMRAAKGKYIARMDSDDISLPTRFEKQLAFMEAHPEVIVCGTWYEQFGDKTGVVKREMPDQETMRCSFIYGNIFGLSHPSAFFRADMLRENGILYDENLPTAQDYGMWTTCIEYGSIANVEEVLVRYRIHQAQVSVAKRALQIECAARVQNRYLSKLYSDITQERRMQHSAYCESHYYMKGMKAWFMQLVRVNEEKRLYDPLTFERFTKEQIQYKIDNSCIRARSVRDVIGLFCLIPLEEHGRIWSILIKKCRRRMIRA